MINLFLDAISGDPASRQHVVWLLSKPTVWLSMIKWGLILLGIGILCKRLLQTRQYIRLTVFIVGCVAAAWGLLELSDQAAQSFREGRLGIAVIGLRVAGLIASVLAVFVVIYLVRAAVRKRA